MEMIIAIKGWLSSNFEMKDIGEADYILGVKILRDHSKNLLGLSQKTYIKKVLERFQMHNCKPIDIPVAKMRALALICVLRLKMKKKRWLVFPMIM